MTELNGDAGIDRDDMIVLLGDEYEEAFLGHDVSVEHPPRAVYSLVLLTRLEKLRMGVGKAKAQASVGALVQSVTTTHGDRAPVFVDDAVSRERDRPRIIRPGGF